MLKSVLPRGLVLILLIVLGLLSLLFGQPFQSAVVDQLRNIILNLALAAFWLLGGLIFNSQYLFPVKTFSARVMALQCLWAWYLGQHRSSYVICDGSSYERIRGSRFYGTAGVVLVDANSAVVMESGLEYTRTIGPDMPQPPGRFSNPQVRSSTFFLDQYELVRGVVDLRPQMRSSRVKALTRDGIEVWCELYVDFEIQRDDSKCHRNTVYTFDNQSVYRAVYGEAIKKDEQRPSEAEQDEPMGTELEEPYRWTDAVINEGVDELRHILSQYTLDQLYAADKPDEDPRTEIETNLCSCLAMRVQSKGVNILRITLGAFRAPELVVAQKVDTWKAEWTRRQTITKAEGESESKRRMEIARALAQLEMIQSITQSLQDEPAPVSASIVAIRLIQALEQMVNQTQVQRGAQLMAPETQKSIETMRQFLAGLNVAKESQKQ